jgi:DNA-binding transcriptional ArsR family regulator
MNNPSHKNIPRKSPRAYEAYAVFFETLANQNRLRIINSLRTGPKNVTQVIETTGLEQTCVSHCLKRLENCGFVTVKRDGKFRVYTLNTRTIGPLMRLIDTHTQTYCIHLIGDAHEHHAHAAARKVKQ